MRRLQSGFMKEKSEVEHFSHYFLVSSQQILEVVWKPGPFFYEGLASKLADKWKHAAGHTAVGWLEA